nr:retrovirus-related Pol polyprotein from transposon TNT 1-94 [Tanacetum cinerariifolium]
MVSGFELTGFSDTDYAGCKDTFKSTSDGAQFLVNGLWLSLQKDYNLLSFKISCSHILQPGQHSRTKHIAVRYHFIKEHVEEGTIELYFVKTDYQLDDIFTKALPADHFNYLVRYLGMRSLSPQELDRLAKSQTFRVILFSIHSDEWKSFQSQHKKALRVYHQRTKKIMETLNVTFDELSAMAFEQSNSNGIYNNNRHCTDTKKSSSQATNIPNTSQDVDELETQQQHQQQDKQALLKAKTIADNVPNAMLVGNSFVNPFATLSTSAVESSSS